MTGPFPPLLGMSILFSVTFFLKCDLQWIRQEGNNLVDTIAQFTSSLIILSVILRMFPRPSGMPNRWMYSVFWLVNEIVFFFFFF